MDIRIFPPDQMVEATVRLPLSKSVSARQLIMDGLSGTASGHPLAECQDTEVLQAAIAVSQGTVDVQASGTALRFLTAYYAATPGTDVTLTGTDRLCHRPIDGLVDALRALGADIDYADRQGYAPLHIRGRRLQGGAIDMDASVSSQYASALMMVAPTMTDGLTITLLNNIASAPYIKMTMLMMEARGADVEMAGQRIIVRPGAYTKAGVPVERDWSAASYWYEITALSAGWVTLPGLEAASVQGDALMRVYGEQLGVNTAFDDEDSPDSAVLSASPEQFSRLTLDMGPTPDLVPAVAITAAVLGIPFRLSGVATLRLKECDRLAVLMREALKLGIVMQMDGDDTLTWEGQRIPLTQLPDIDPADDHRMAMAFAPVSVFVPGMIIRNAQTVSKSYPNFWHDLQDAGFTFSQVGADTDDSQPADTDDSQQ